MNRHLLAFAIRIDKRTHRCEIVYVANSQIHGSAPIRPACHRVVIFDIVDVLRRVDSMLPDFKAGLGDAPGRNGPRQTLLPALVVARETKVQDQRCNHDKCGGKKR